ncbi:MAG: aminotransferase class V-fold PLP-dependent enzyme [Thermaerobacter sp.]|nr:aminotransferase class V-fold PLP-dependent enzyme [Thermaerobacter sp.]
MSTPDILSFLAKQLKPYRGRMETVDRLPERGRSHQEVLSLLEQLRQLEAGRWQTGYASGAVYHGGAEHTEFLSAAYKTQSQSNPLHPDIWPSAAKFEAEVVAMTARMLSGDAVRTHRRGDRVVGAVSTGGTESILLAMLAYRDWGREEKGIAQPEIVVPVTAHAAFEKAAHYFGLRLVRVPVAEDLRADVEAMRAAVNENTVVLVASAPSFPHGVIDPIEEIAALAGEHDIGCHVDACLGGFVLPWAERLGYPVPPFDFRVPGVTSISVDTHKYGFAAKGTSVVLYRSADLFHHQCYTAADWPGGLYVSSTLLGSRPGALIAAAWAALVATGEDGYMAAAKGILAAADRLKQGVREIPDLKVLGDPLFVVAIASDTLDIYQVMEQMAQRGWSLNGLHHPPAFHIALTRRHAEEGVVERFLSDLQASTDEVRRSPEVRTGMAPLYGMAAMAPGELVHGLLEAYIDVLYEV